MTPDEYCQDKAARSGSSFYYSFLFLPPPRRRAITALYAFCREVDDVVDEVSEPSVAAAKLAWWRGEVADAFAGHPTHPVTQALMPHVADYGIEAAQLNAVIDGCRIDLEQAKDAIASLDELAAHPPVREEGSCDPQRLLRLTGPCRSVARRSEVVDLTVDDCESLLPARPHEMQAGQQICEVAAVAVLRLRPPP